MKTITQTLRIFMILNLLALSLIAADDPDVEIKTVAKNIEKINAKADFTIIEAHA